MDLTQLITGVIGTLLGSGGTVFTYLGIRKAKKQKAVDNEIEANRLVITRTTLESAEDEKVWSRQEAQFAKMEAKLTSLEQRISTLETENSGLKAGIAVHEVWAARFIMSAQQAGQATLIPYPLPIGLSAYFPNLP